METCSTVNLESTDMKDPFSQWNTFSLLSKTFRSSNKSMALDHHDLDPLQNLLGSMKPEDQTKLIEQATTILNSNLDFPNHDGTSQIPSNDQDGTTIDHQPKRQRQGLGHKRARFTLMHNKSEPVTQADPKAVLKQLEDPEEFFAALERIEFAEKEKKRLRGETVSEPSQPNRERIRRPGLNLGRKSSYKHVYPKFPSNAENTEPSLGSKSDVIVLSPSKAPSNLVSKATDKTAAIWDRDTHDKPLDDGLEKDSRLEKESRSGGSLKEVLDVCRDLDEGQTLKLLQERFGLQSLVLDKQKNPELDRSLSHDHTAFQGLLQSPKWASSIVHPLTASSNPPDLASERQKSVEKLFHTRIVSSQVRSPLSLVSALGRISQTIVETDLVSLHNAVAGTSPVSSDKGILASRSPPVCIDQTCDGSSSFQLEVPNEGTDKKAVSCSIDFSENDPSTGSVRHAKHTPCDGSSSFLLEVPNEGTDEKAVSHSIDFSENDPPTGSVRHAKHTPSISEKRKSLKSRMQISGNEAGCTRNCDFDSEALVRQQSSSQVDMLTGDSTIESEKASDKDQESLVYKELNEGFTIGSVHEDKTSSTPTCPSTNENVENTSFVSEQINEEVQIPPPTPGKRMRQKVQSCKPSKKRCQPRFSLAGAGTSWECGTRRSTRVKSKPLQWWKGERLLYGRVHNSLVTVIGAKYVTSADEKKEREFKVVSFVTNDYKDLVEQAAQH